MTATRQDLHDCLYWGPVVHRRHAPLRHMLRYHVFTVLVDIDQLGTLHRRSWLIGYNRRCFLAIRDRDHGPGDGTPIAQHVWNLVRQWQGVAPKRIFMLGFPRILGRLFNPLTVFIAVDEAGAPVLMIYEVSNTFGQRHSYVVAATPAGIHRVEKKFHVSPYNLVEGEYRFHLHPLAQSLRLDIAYFVKDKLVMAARMEGVRQPLTTRRIAAAGLGLVLQPLKVWGGIHWEALKLYAKGLRPSSLPDHPAFAVSGPASPDKLQIPPVKPAVPGLNRPLIRKPL